MLAYLSGLARNFKRSDHPTFENVRLCLTLRVPELFFDSVDGVDQVSHED
jgi:hypothetical protein